MADDKKDDDKPAKKSTAKKMMRVTIHRPSPGAKVFTSMGTLGNGACVNLPEGEARRFLDLGLARLTESTADEPGAKVDIIEDRPITP
ncbi:MAG: hypothetical protein KAT39_00345 [Alphaproteobacteria bacterium]|nr:hypothetical protein [Alphaproteobacteria bacterium]